MCTVTWTLVGGGYELFFNRDELRTRARAWPPTVRAIGGVECLAPIDGDARGTWLGVNAHGLSVGLLNGAPPRGPKVARPSRGQLVLGLLDGASSIEVEARLAGVDVARFAPFRLFALDAAGGARAFRWDGSELTVERDVAAGTALISSSRDAEGAERERSAVLARLRGERGLLDAALLREFHTSHAPERGPYSVCMHREDARTVSFSRIRVAADTIEFVYHDGPPCTPAETAQRRLARR